VVTINDEGEVEIRKGEMTEREGTQKWKREKKEGMDHGKGVHLRFWTKLTPQGVAHISIL